jgi:hypothetical protein
MEGQEMKARLWMPGKSPGPYIAPHGHRIAQPLFPAPRPPKAQSAAMFFLLALDQPT